MQTNSRTVRGLSAALMVLAVSACSSGAGGGLGDILGAVLGGGGATKVAGTVQAVDSRDQEITLRQSNGQNVDIGFDNQTAVIYQNRVYAVTSLESGDQVQARVQQLQSGGYYADSIWVTQPVQGSGTSTSGGTAGVQSLTGTVRSVDRNAGVFTIDVGNNTTLTVSMPYNASSTDVNKFNALRSGDYVRFYGVYLNTTRVELRQFY